jgi:hypothetical protein
MNMNRKELAEYRLAQIDKLMKTLEKEKQEQIRILNGV